MTVMPLLGKNHVHIRGRICLYGVCSEFSNIVGPFVRLFPHSKAILYVVLLLGKSHLMKGLRIFIHLWDFPSILGAVAFEL